jgi:hypothetical protein
MITHDATLAFTQALLALADVPRDAEPYAEGNAHHVQVQGALLHLARVLELLRRGAAPDVRVVTKFLTELEEANV